MSAHRTTAIASAHPLGRQLGWLIGVSALCYLAILGLSLRFQYGEGYQERPILLVLALFAVLTLGYLLALWLIRLSTRTSTVMNPAEMSRLLRLVVAGALIFRLILLLSTPIQEIDYYRYLWDGRVLLAGVSPYQFAPEQIENWRWGAKHQETRHYLWQQAQQSDTTELIFQRVHHRQVPTVYPPAAQAVFAAAALVTPASAPLWQHLLVFKLFVLVFDIGTLFVLVSLLRRLSLAPIWSLAYGWCPLVLKEVVNSAHLDTIAVFCTTLCIRLLVEVHFRVAEQKAGALSLACAAAAALALGILAKCYPLVLVPVVGAFLLGRLRYQIAVPALVFAAVLVLGYAPFLALAAGDTPGEALDWPTAAEGVVSAAGKDFGQAHQPWTGLGTFLGMWEMNDFLFMLLHENLRPPSAVAAPWFALTPASWRTGLDHSVSEVMQALALLAPERSPVFLLAQGLLGLLLLVLTLRWAWQAARSPEPLPLLRGVFLTLAWGWLLSAAPNPWYLLWCLPFMVFTGRLSWFLLPGLSLLYYLRFWMEYRAWGDPAAVAAARMAFDYGIIWLEYLPFLLLLILEAVLQRRRIVKPRKVQPAHEPKGKRGIGKGELRPITERVA